MSVDIRERGLLAALEQLATPHEAVSLCLGDIELRGGDQEVVRVERKTWEDLRASVRDGRFREQRERLRSNARSPDHVVYLFEGALPADPDVRKMAVGAWLNLLRDGFRVVRVLDTAEAAYWLSQCVRKLAAGEPWSAAPEEGDVRRAHDCGLHLSVRRSGNLDRATLFALQLSVVPGISMEVARFLAGQFGSWGDVVGELAPLDPKSRRARLAALRAPQSKRALGPKLAERLLELLFCEKSAVVQKSHEEGNDPAPDAS